MCRGDNGVYILVNSVPSLGPSRVVVDDQAHYLFQRVQFAIREVSVLGVLLCALLGREPSEEGVYWKRASRTARAQCRVDAVLPTGSPGCLWFDGGGDDCGLCCAATKKCFVRGVD